MHGEVQHYPIKPCKDLHKIKRIRDTKLNLNHSCNPTPSLTIDHLPPSFIKLKRRYLAQIYHILNRLHQFTEGLEVKLID